MSEGKAAAPAAEVEPKEAKGEKGDKPDKAAEKARARAEREAKKAEEKAARVAAETAELGDAFGKLPLVQSQSLEAAAGYTELDDINANVDAYVGRTLRIRARLQAVRVTGRNAFLVLRRGGHCLQAAASAAPATAGAEGDKPAADATPKPDAPAGRFIPRAAVKFLGALSPESIVDVRGELVRPPPPEAGAPAVEILAATGALRQVEIALSGLWVVSAAAVLPFTLGDASAPEADDRASVNPELRLDTRWLDLRTPAIHAAFVIQALVEREFRRSLEAKGFIGIHTPKIIGGASEGGSAVFKVDYFGRAACLAQSPQLYKQMAVMGDVAAGVFEIGHVFRAEDSNTARHLTEFVGLDVEMGIKAHYFEVLDVAEDLFAAIFDALAAPAVAPLLAAIRSQYPSEPLVYRMTPARIRETGVSVLSGAGARVGTDPGRVRSEECGMLRLPYPAGVEMVNAAVGAMSKAEAEELKVAVMPATADLSTPNEKLLGRLVREKYGVDWYILDRYPAAVRPFYTMPAADDPAVSNSYDMFIRGEEISSGAQRIHDPALLRERAAALGVPTADKEAYISSFSHGAWPHGGFGVGLERVVFLYCNLKNIRRASMFPRDPVRITP